MVGSVGMKRGDYSLFVNGFTMSSVNCHHMEYTLLNHDFVLLFSSMKSFFLLFLCLMIRRTLVFLW